LFKVQVLNRICLFQCQAFFKFRNPITFLSQSSKAVLTQYHLPAKQESHTIISRIHALPASTPAVQDCLDKFTFHFSVPSVVKILTLHFSVCSVYSVVNKSYITL